jgi:PPOX class probable F420-dependent enzyme
MTLELFNKQQYLNLETFRKNGQSVKTPVWFAQDGETLRIWTQADSGKAKRIRRDGNVRIVPSTASGEPVSEWVKATATVIDETEEIKKTVHLFRKKYGFMFNVFGMFGWLRKAKYTTIEVMLS